MAGLREQYQPIKSLLAPDSSPGTVARALVDQLGATQVYLADLDAIGGGDPAWDIYRQIANCGLQLWVDAGIGSAEQAQRMAGPLEGSEPLQGIIIGLESLQSRAALADICSVVSPSRLVFSLDLNRGQPITSHPSLASYSALQIAQTILEAGIVRIIVLDLAQVGVYSGPGTLELCRQLHQEAPRAELIAGGGVRHIEDVRALENAGCHTVLIASALHDGRLTVEAVREAGWQI